MNEVSKAYKSILKEYRDDMVKYAPDKDKPHIRECFNSIPKQLAKENKKFQYNKVKPGGRSDTYLGGFKGAIFENLMADTLHKKKQNLYYFQKDSGLELDFLIRMKGECVPLEVKAKNAQAKSSKTVLAHPEKYHVKHIIKFGDYNIGRDSGLLTLPNYMQFLLDLEPEDVVLEPIDTEELTRLAREALGKLG